MKLLLSIIAVFLLTISLPAQVWFASNATVRTMNVVGVDASVAVSSNYITSIYNKYPMDYNGDVGFKLFSLPYPMVVTHLGRFVLPGSSQTHTLQIKGDSCDSLASVSANLSGAPTNDFYWVPLTTPVTLTNGAHYSFVSSETKVSEGGDPCFEGYVDAGATNYTLGDPSLTNHQAEAYGPYCSLSLTNWMFGQVNFKYYRP